MEFQFAPMALGLRAVRRMTLSAILVVCISLHSSVGGGGTANWNCTSGQNSASTSVRQQTVPDQSGTLSGLITAKPANLAAIRAVIRSGANPNRIDEHGETPLGLATRLGISPVVECLLASGANPNTRERNGWTPLYAGISNISIVRLLVSRGADIRIQAARGYNVLMRAAEVGAVDSCRFLIARGLSVRAKDAGGRTALHAAATNGNVVLIRLLILAGAAPTATTADGITPLESASLQSNAKAVAELLRIQQVRRSHNAINGALFRVFRIVLMNGIALKRDPFGMPDTVALLLAHGANVAQRNMQGQTPLLYAISELKENSTDYLFVNFPAYYLLLKAGADINTQDAAGKTVLMLAAAPAGNRLISFLLYKGAKPGLLDKNGKTALMYLAANLARGDDLVYSALNERAAELMIQYRDNRSARDNSGKTAQDIAKGAGNDILAGILDPSRPLPDRNTYHE